MPRVTSAFAAVLLISVAARAGAQRLTYPDTKKVDQVDTYFGVAVADPYRWLENEGSPEVAAWVDAENRVTSGYLDRIPTRSAIRARLEKLQNYARYTAPVRRGELYVYSKNDGLQNQSVVYVQRGLDGTAEVLLDPNTFSRDGTNRLAGLSLSRDGKYTAFGVSSGGSDWTEYHVMETASRRMLPDTLRWAKVSGIAWQGNGFYYSRYDAPDSTRALTSKNEGHKVYYHVVGTPQSSDSLVYSDAANPQRFHTVQTTEDQRWAVLSVSDRGKGKKGNALFVRDAKAPARGWQPLVADIGDDEYNLVDAVPGGIMVHTNRAAPNWRVVVIDPAHPEEANWHIVLPQRREVLQSASTAGGKLFATYMKDVASTAYVYDLRGRLQNEIALPGLGAVSGFGGNDDDKQVFYTFTSFTVPPSIYAYDIATRRSSVYRAPVIPGFDPADYETKELFYPTKDNQYLVPLFVTYKKGVKLNGENPLLLYGYGGFNISTTPSFSALRLALLEQGVVYASANIRGGGEYGEKWHAAGTKLQKQNVFDDFIGAAQYLVNQAWTRPGKLAIHGVSNGGLLVGAVANQRPDLFKVVIQQAGVMDMLRFQKFTIGWNWIADYGSSEASAAEFNALRAYSPVHNVKPGTSYPATLITTADHDDRVVPAHSFKYAAALQAAQAGDNPILIRIDTKSGHGASSTTKLIEQTTDLYAFIFQNLGMTPTFVP